MSQSHAPGWPDDETLVAFADGQLPPEEAARVAQFLEANAEARRFVERLKLSGSLAQAAFDEVLHPPVPDTLESLLRGETARESPAAGGAASNVVSLPAAHRRKSAARFARPLAASVVLVVCAVAGYVIGKNWGAGGANRELTVAVGPVVSGSPVATLLEQQPSGHPRSLEGTRSIMVVATFRDGVGRVCREFEITPGDVTDAQTIGAVACRQPGGGWQVEGAVRTTGPGTAYNPASGRDVSAMQGILEALGAKPHLSRSEEDALLSNGWK